MKPSQYAVEILILDEPEYPDGLYAWVDYDNEEEVNDRLKWFCENDFWLKYLTLSLSQLPSASPLNHYEPDDPNPPLAAARCAARYFKIKILSEGMVGSSGLPEGSLDFDDDVDENPYVKDDADE